MKNILKKIISITFTVSNAIFHSMIFEWLWVVCTAITLYGTYKYRPEPEFLLALMLFFTSVLNMVSRYYAKNLELKIKQLTDDKKSEND